MAKRPRAKREYVDPHATCAAQQKRVVAEICKGALEWLAMLEVELEKMPSMAREDRLKSLRFGLALQLDLRLRDAGGLTFEQVQAIERRAAEEYKRYRILYVGSEKSHEAAKAEMHVDISTKTDYVITH